MRMIKILILKWIRYFSSTETSLNRCLDMTEWFYYRLSYFSTSIPKPEFERETFRTSGNHVKTDISGPILVWIGDCTISNSYIKPVVMLFIIIISEIQLDTDPCDRRLSGIEVSRVPSAKWDGNIIIGQSTIGLSGNRHSGIFFASISLTWDLRRNYLKLKAEHIA